MAETDDGAGELSELERHLEIHGARPERWPEAARRRLGPLLEREDGARELLAEARALEHLLDRAPSSDQARITALADRIADLAGGEAPGRAEAAVVDLSARRSRAAARRPRPVADWKVASALAASLPAGILLGTTAPILSTVEVVAEAVGLATAGDDANLALFEDGGASEEEAL